ncbi:phage tail fiber protein [Providencia vermicola]|uniref:phage tail fiber protein n=1 Tax=Providencia vermicola TaxID=333965 RepID=UPI003D2858A0
MHNIGTVTTTANSPKITGTGTRWKDNSTLVSVGQIVLIENGSTLIINCIDSIESNTALTLGFPVSAKLTNVKYRILTTMIDSISDGVNKATAQVIASEMFTDIFTELMTGTGTIEFELPNGQKVKLRTENEKDKLLDGKLDKAGGQITKNDQALAIKVAGENQANYIGFLDASGYRRGLVGYGNTTDDFAISNTRSGITLKLTADGKALIGSAEIVKVGDYGLGAINGQRIPSNDYNLIKQSGFFAGIGGTDGKNIPPKTGQGSPQYGAVLSAFRSAQEGFMIVAHANECMFRPFQSSAWGSEYISFLTVKNTTKDSNGNLKAASPIVKLFSDDFELNDESEGVEMEHLGVGHYLIKGVVGFNADGAWGINNGFVIPQDHNGKNMVLIDYEVRPDGDIEIFVFHQQNADMPERFQNKRIKHFDEDGVPVYFENFEPCDVPESRWIDMRVEMPPNSLYNQKQAEAERLAKIEAERLAEEEAKRAEEAERAEQEATERKQYGLGDNSVLL